MVYGLSTAEIQSTIYTGSSELASHIGCLVVVFLVDLKLTVVRREPLFGCHVPRAPKSFLLHPASFPGSSFFFTHKRGRCRARLPLKAREPCWGPSLVQHRVLLCLRCLWVPLLIRTSTCSTPNYNPNDLHPALRLQISIQG